MNPFHFRFGFVFLFLSNNVEQNASKSLPNLSSQHYTRISHTITCSNPTLRPTVANNLVDLLHAFNRRKTRNTLRTAPAVRHKCDHNNRKKECVQRWKKKLTRNGKTNPFSGAGGRSASPGCQMRFASRRLRRKRPHTRRRDAPLLWLCVCV